MADHHRKKRFVKREFYKNPFCPQCGVLMVLPETIPQHAPGKIKIWPLNTATYEHVHSRLNPNRGIREVTKNKILCLKCNNENGRLDELKARGVILNSKTSTEP
jgi:hypothetical protein